MSTYGSNMEAAALCLPNLPGYKAKEFPPGQKKRFFQIVGGQTFIKDEYIQPSPEGDEDSSVTSIIFSRPKTVTNLDLVNMILTYQAYFEESSSFSTTTIDSKRVRKCNIYYYLENNTLSIVEKSQMNSGMPQGTIVRRDCIKKSDGTTIVPEDLHLGGEITIYGRLYHIVDCDEATRKYLRRNLNVNMNFSLATPQDPYEAYRKSLEKGPSNDWGMYRTKKNQNKTFMEAQLGNTVNNKGREGFIKFGQQSLKFRCVWDNTAMLYGDRLEFSLVYYLADDTIEIFSIPNGTMGKDQFTKLLKRSKLPKSAGSMVVGEHDEVGECYTWRDLYIGLELNVYARKLRIIDADKNTREFYDSEEMTLGPSEYVAESLSNSTTISHGSDTPQSTSHDDASVTSTTNSITTTLSRKLGENRMLAFFAALLSGGPDDVNRRFVISFYVQDGTVKILEPPVRNSGFVGGLFLSRRPIKLENGEPLTEKHLYVGCKLRILNHHFELLEANESTLRWMEDQKLPRASFYDILDKLRGPLLQDAQTGALARRFRAYQTMDIGEGLATKDTLRSILMEYRLFGDNDNQVCEHEVLTILRANGNRTSTFNFEKVIAQIIRPTDEFK